MVSPSSRRMIGNVRSFVGNSLGGLRGWSNLASWAVAGTLAYFLWVKPTRELKAEQFPMPVKSLHGFVREIFCIIPCLAIKERAALAAASDPNRYIEKRKPIPDPQDTGLIYGKRTETKKPQN